MSKKFPDNLKCAKWNDYYFTHCYDTNLIGYKEYELYYLFASESDIKNNNAYRSGFRTKVLDNSINIRSVIKNRFNSSYYESHSSGNYEELSFSELPEKVKKIFRRFEKFDDFRISEYLQSIINNINKNWL